MIGSLGFGGAERTLIDIVTHLDRRRFRVEVACLFRAGELARELEAVDVPVTVLGMSPSVRPDNWLRVAQLVRSINPDIVHAHLPDACWYALPAAWWGRVPARIGHVQNVYRHWPAKLRLLDGLCMSVAGGVVVCSYAVQQFCEARRGYPLSRIRVIHNSVDLGRFDSLPSRDEARSALGLPTEGPVITAVASLTPQKGHSDLLEAVAKVRTDFPNLLLLLVGRGPLRDALEDMARRLGLAENVHFLGARKDVPAILAASDVAVLSSHWEGLSLALAEAGAAGLPVVATEVDGIPEIVQHGVTGLLVPPRRPQLLAEALHALLRDPSRRQQMGEAARRWVAERFSVERMVRETESLYVELLGKAGR